MKIQDYFFETDEDDGGCSGSPGAALSAYWTRWHDFAAEDKTAFLDFPEGSENRLLICALPYEKGTVRVGFSIPLPVLPDAGAFYALYIAILSWNADAVLKSIEAKEALDLDFQPCDLEPLPMPSAFSELNGLQMIGSVKKSLHMVAKMLPEEDPAVWSGTFYLAVNPASYADEFTSVISEETPQGEWQKLRSEHTEFGSAQTFRERRRTWLRRHLMPRYALAFAVSAVCMILLFISLFCCLRVIRNLRNQLIWSQEENQALRFQMQRQEEKLRLLKPDQR